MFLNAIMQTYAKEKQSAAARVYHKMKEKREKCGKSSRSREEKFESLEMFEPKILQENY